MGQRLFSVLIYGLKGGKVSIGTRRGVVGADQVDGAGGSAGPRGQVRAPLRMAAAGDEASEGTEGREGRGGVFDQDDEHALPEARRGDDFADVVEERGGDQVGVVMALRLKLVRDLDAVQLLGVRHPLEERVQRGREVHTDVGVIDRAQGRDQGERKLLHPVPNPS